MLRNNGAGGSFRENVTICYIGRGGVPQSEISCYVFFECSLIQFQKEQANSEIAVAEMRFQRQAKAGQKKCLDFQKRLRLIVLEYPEF